jgi:hypothetical protein
MRAPRRDEYYDSCAWVDAGPERGHPELTASGKSEKDSKNPKFSHAQYSSGVFTESLAPANVRWLGVCSPASYLLPANPSTYRVAGRV